MSAHPTILLLNPPHRRRVVRDCYCSDIVKTNYYWHPMDLLVQAGLLDAVGRVVGIDAVAERLTADETLRRVRELKPDWVLTLVGHAAGDDDLRFCRSLRDALLQARIFGSGDVFWDDGPAALRRFDALDGALMDFTSPVLADLVRSGTPTYDLLWRDGEEIRVLPRRASPSFSYPPPASHLFVSRRYRLPFYGDRPFYSLLASYGCPYQCRFCHGPSLGYRWRPAEETAAEFGVAYRQGYRRFYVRDATFGVRRDDALDLCARLTAQRLDVRWNCFVRADLLDDALLGAMAKAGCLIVQIGAETLDPRAATQMQKNVDRAQLREVLRNCRRRGLRTSLHFVLGLPNDQWSFTGRAFDDILDLNPDYLSLNVLQLRPGTALRGDKHVMTPEEIARCRALARRWNRRFYLRPRRLLTELWWLRDPASIWRNAMLFASQWRRADASDAE
jgi:hypothetical protein